MISSVNCSASVSSYVSQRFTREALRDYPNVDGVIAITHKGGCALQYGGPDHQQLDRTLAGFAKHPNVGAYILDRPGLRDRHDRLSGEPRRA